MKADHIKVKIKGATWKVFLLSEEGFIKRFGEGIAGVCLTDDKKIYFHDGELNREVVVHEMVHAYWADMCLSSTRLTNDQLEEVWADMFARFGATLLRQSNAILRHLRKRAQ